MKTFSRPLGIYEKKGGHKHTVEIFNKTCTCKKWETFKIPCSHAFACMQHLRIHPSRLIESWCFNENQILIYQKSFRPIGDRNTWMQEDDLPYFVPMSDEARTSGRPQTGRFHNEMDMKWQPQKNRCSVCRRPGHNKATCLRKKG